MIGKDPTLTGRTELWAYVNYYISERPVLGWGLYAFWASANPAAEEIWSEVGWTPPHAHNGLLEMLLEVGIVGTAFFVFLWVRNATLAVLALRTPAKELGISSLLCLGGIVVVGVSEVALVDPSQSSVLVFFVTGLICERMLWEARRRRLPAVPRARSVPVVKASA
jgi:O-antigen ligase